MATPTVDHHFNGDGKLLHATTDRRTEIRKALTALQQELRRIEGHPVQVVTSITFNVLGSAPREHVYTVNVTDAEFGADSFAKSKTPAGRLPSGSAALPLASTNADGRPGSVSSSSRGHGADDADGRPPKRARADGENESVMRNGSTSGLPSAQRVDDLARFMKKWHDEWTRQGGWLFDSLNAISKTQKTNVDHLDHKLDALQDILGQSINSATATNMAELANIAKLIPWLEHCRKTNADKVQAREEKWRSSSATFHDQNRREREAAEARLEKKLEAQRQLLVKIAESNGIDVDDGDEDDEKRSEASLGAQLTAELNAEAGRAENEKGSTVTTISIN